MISVLPTLHTWGRILTAAGGVLGVLVAVPAFRLGGVWKTCLRIAAFVLILGLSMLLEEQVLSSAGLSRIVKQPSLVGAIDESILTSSRTEDFGDHLVLSAVELRPFEHPILSVQPWKDGSMTRVVERPPELPLTPARVFFGRNPCLAARAEVLSRTEKDLLRTEAMRATALNIWAAVIGLSGGGRL